MFPSFALTAWKGTGKDTFFQELTTLRLSTSAPETDAKWVVYYSPSTRRLHALKALFDSCVAKQRFAFADALKVETHNYLRLKNCPANAFENVKEIALFQAYPATEFKTMRTFYKERAQYARALDPLTWTRIVHSQIEQERKSHEFIDVITDWRFENELLKRHDAKRQPLTIRLHRKDALVPDFALAGEEESEHALDDFTTDFLLIPPGREEYEIAMSHFPQYMHFKKLCFVYSRK